MIENVKITRLKRTTENEILFRDFQTEDINFLDIVALLSGSWQLIPRSILPHYYALSGILCVVCMEC